MVENARGDTGVMVVGSRRIIKETTMIIGRIAGKPADLKQLPATLAAAFAETLKHDLTKEPAKRYELSSVPGAFFFIQDGRTKPEAETRPEAHAKMIDIQYLVKGHERFGMAQPQALTPTEDAMAEKDIAFYPAPAGEFFYDAAPGDFLVYFPTEIHRPMGAVGAPEDLRKVVVKIPMAAL
jgi:biofilm protein TabA